MQEPAVLGLGFRVQFRAEIQLFMHCQTLCLLLMSSTVYPRALFHLLELLREGSRDSVPEGPSTQ